MSDKGNGIGLFDRLKLGLEDGIEFAKGTRSLRTIDVPDEPPPLGKRDVMRIRGKIGLSQMAFAKLLNVSVTTVRSWETGERRPSRAALRLLQVVCGMQAEMLSLVGLGGVGARRSRPSGRRPSGRETATVEK